MDATNWYEKLCIKYSSALSERIVRSPPTDIKMPFKRDDVHNHHSHMLLLMTLFMGHAFDEFNSGPCKISDAERQLHKEVFGDLSGSQKKGLILVGEPYDIKRMTTDFFYNDYMSTKKLLNIFIHETNCSQRHRRYILEL